MIQNNISDPLIFKTKQDLEKWFLKNHKIKSDFWVLIAKKIAQFQTVSMNEVVEVGICYGWVISILKSIDGFSYKLQLVKRKPKSIWGLSYTKKFLQLKKQGKIKPAGLLAYKQRDIKKSENKEFKFTETYIRLFKKNKKAWLFFKSQTPSYQKEMTRWVMSAKRTETQMARLNELIFDSADGTKLKRILKMIEKYQNKKHTYPLGATPVEVAKNIGPLTGIELRSVGIETVEQLKSLGWEKCFYKLVELYPHRINLNMIYGLIGAVEDVSYLKLDPELKSEARTFLKQYKSEFRS